MDKIVNVSLSLSLWEVLAVLAGLVLIVFLFSRLFSGGRAKKPQSSAPAATQAPVGGGQAISPETMAAITAAIAMVWDSPNGFQVRHVKRVHNAPAWNRAGREEQAYSRF